MDIEGDWKKKKWDSTSEEKSKKPPKYKSKDSKRERRWVKNPFKYRTTDIENGIRKKCELKKNNIPSKIVANLNKELAKKEESLQRSTLTTVIGKLASEALVSTTKVLAPRNEALTTSDSPRDTDRIKSGEKRQSESSTQSRRKNLQAFEFSSNFYFFSLY